VTVNALPFTAREFFELFGHYNVTVWPAQLLLNGIAVLIIAHVVLQERPGLVFALLALLWLWMGVVYHLAFFTTINPAARLFGVAFIAQAMFFLSYISSPTASPRAQATLTAPVGKALVAYALVGYPLLGSLLGHHYPEVPTFGAPCPTTIFTLGILHWRRPGTPAWLAAIPLAWSGIGTAAAIQLSVPQDYGLTLAGLATIALLVGRRRMTRDARLTPRSL
jgi:hypothetical protein